MSVPVAWKTNESFCGANDPLGREDTANKYLRGLYTLFRTGHDAAAAHKSTVYGIPFMRTVHGSYTGTGALQTVTLSNASLNVQAIDIVADATEYPVFATGQSRGWTKIFDAADYTGIPSFSTLIEYDGALHGLGANIQDGNEEAQIWEYNGTTWTKVYESPSWYTNNLIYDAVVFGGNLWTAGSKVDSGTGSSQSLVGYWDGTSWTQSLNVTGAANARLIEVFDGNLYVILNSGGLANAEIHKWNGTSWAKVLDMENNSVNGSCLKTFGSHLYYANSTTGASVYKYDGTSAVSILTLPSGELADAMEVYDGALWLSSLNVSAGKAYLRSYDGSAWSSAIEIDGVESRMSRLGVFNGQLYASMGYSTDAKIGRFNGTGIDVIIDLEALDASYSRAIDLIEFDGVLCLTMGQKSLEWGQYAKELGTNEMFPDKVVDVDTVGQFTLGADDSVNKSGETYYYTAYGVED